MLLNDIIYKLMVDGCSTNSRHFRPD